MKAHIKHKKVRYNGLAKNRAQLFSLFELANLVIAEYEVRSFQEYSERITARMGHLRRIALPCLHGGW